MELKPDWPKGYIRCAMALHGLWRYAEALEKYEKALELDPGNESAKAGLAKIQTEKKDGEKDSEMED
jgi:cytochrome c-type biogenesis protein CcmH/NrfG